jgi:hypothetical protein
MANSSRKYLLFALRRILLPLIRISVRAGVRYDEFATLVRGVYVEAAVIDGVGAPTKPSRARIAIATGVGRAEVDRIVDNNGSLPQSEKTFTNTLAKVLSSWHTDPQFVGPYGIPLELPRRRRHTDGLKTADGSRTFAELVHSVDPTADPDEVCDELVRFGAVGVFGDTHLRVNSRAMIATEEMSPAQLELFGNSLTRLANTLQFNIDQRNPIKRIERSVIAEKGIPLKLVPEVQEEFRQRVIALLTDLDNWMSPRMEQPGPRTSAMGLAVFEFEDLEEEIIVGSLKDRVGGDSSDR